MTDTQTDDGRRRVLRLGALLALGLVFVSLVGLPVGLDRRILIDPIFSLGYLSLLWLPLMIGWVVAKRVVLEGMDTPEPGSADVVAGAAVGVVGGLGLSALVLLMGFDDEFAVRDPLVNWSVQLFDFLNFDNGAAFGLVAWPVICATLSAFGAALHWMPSRLRRAVVSSILTVVGLAVFESFVVDVVDPLEDILYSKTGGLTIVSAVLVALFAAIASAAGGGELVREAKASYAASTGEARKRSSATLIAITLAALIIIPMITGKITQELLANVSLFLLLALGLNIVVGLAGILDLGYVAFFAVGGYATAVLTAPKPGESWPEWLPHLSWPVALLVTVVLAAIVGLMIGAPVIRMRGDYLAIVTLGFGEIIRLLFGSDALNGYFGGAQGIIQIPPADFGIFEVSGPDPRSVFYLALFFVVISIYISWRLERSRLGRAWMAVREDESVAEAMGVNTVNVKLQAFVVGAVIASFSGAIFSAKVGAIFPSSFLILISIIILVVVIVGGMGNIVGVIVGTVVLIGVLGGPRQPGLLQEFSQYKLLIYGALLVWMMLQRPEGLVPNARRSRELHQDEFLQDAWLKGDVDPDEEEVPA